MGCQLHEIASDVMHFLGEATATSQLRSSTMQIVLQLTSQDLRLDEQMKQDELYLTANVASQIASWSTKATADVDDT